MKTKKQTTRRNVIRNERGLATVETIPLLFLFVFLICYTFGTFGIIHTGIMHSISARAYAFETFRNRTNLVYFRENEGNYKHYLRIGARIHTVTDENRPPGSDQFEPSERALRMGLASSDLKGRTEANHNERIPADVGSLGQQKRNTKFEASPVWIMVQYGICLDNRCGGE
ncbi:MAG: hypothetical protein AAB250_10300 [Bdellovibrionota bacterium]